MPVEYPTPQKPQTSNINSVCVGGKSIWDYEVSFVLFVINALSRYNSVSIEPN